MKWKSGAAAIIRYAGVYVSYEIGSGFATGQEIKQFFTVFGGWGIAGIFLAMALLSWLGATLLAEGYERREQNSGLYLAYWGNYWGNYWGRLFEWVTLFIMFSTLVVMLSGAGAILGEYYGLDRRIGSLLMSVLIFITHLGSK